MSVLCSLYVEWSNSTIKETTKGKAPQRQEYFMCAL